MESLKLKEECTKWRDFYLKGQKWWSVAHHVAAFGVIICSIAAGAIIQAELEHSKIIASTLTAVAAALSGLSVSGGFERKWRSNRLSRSRTDGLLLDLENNPDPSPDPIVVVN
ncbi:hypothetical protein BLL42_03485 [Pseudomonas frederiksbergensis]|uniref:SMODS and SLOG-associating 2TM effector domain-containing protein n=1 Tax=Pseudomonas frederiksbergensis TaxID=104087 RepID=A0A1J0EFL2_9PSED|nr:hypothetical protein [Pseudomonas frederiksbergensis]APC14830.1 hypothetical protein BLL42_03485 [Pseudomonas frederiksbergensis]